jgi:hypothetical protein
MNHDQVGAAITLICPDSTSSGYSNVLTDPLVDIFISGPRFSRNLHDLH